MYLCISLSPTYERNKFSLSYFLKFMNIFSELKCSLLLQGIYLHLNFMCVDIWATKTYVVLTHYVSNERRSLFLYTGYKTAKLKFTVLQQTTDVFKL